MNDQAPIKKGRKYDQVLEGARDVFIREGYEGASVDQIAKDAGVSKATLYSYFTDKQALFAAVLTNECDGNAETLMSEEIMQLPVEESLHFIACGFLEFLFSEFSTEVFRLCMAETRRFPDTAREFYMSGPKSALDQLTTIFKSERFQQSLDIHDFDVAADQFLQLCRTDLLLRRLLGIVDTVSEEEINAVAKETVTTFLARYRRT